MNSEFEIEFLYIEQLKVFVVTTWQVKRMSGKLEASLRPYQTMNTSELSESVTGAIGAFHNVAGKFNCRHAFYVLFEELYFW